MNETTSSVASIVNVLSTIIDNNIQATLPTTINQTLLYKAGSELTPTVLGQLSY